MLRLGQEYEDRIAGTGAGGHRGGRAEPWERWPDEVRTLLLNADKETDALRNERRALAARVARLEQRLEAVNHENRELAARLADAERRRRDARPSPGIEDDNWIADVADRTSSTLKSAHDTAKGLVDGARRRATEIERAAQAAAAEIRARAEAEADAILATAQVDAERLVKSARASGEELLAEARRMRDRAINKLRERRAAVQDEIAALEACRLRLLETYASIRRPVEEAVRLLQEGPDRRPPPSQPPRGIGRARRERSEAPAERPTSARAG